MRGQPTRSLIEHVRGDPAACERLIPLIYGELRALAGHFMQAERPGHTLQPTALVHEAYLRLIDIDRVDWNGRTHFLAMAAREMRRVLIDHARRRGAEKRGGDLRRITLSEDLALTEDRTIDAIALHEAIERMSTRRARRARIAELCVYGGLTQAEIALVLGISERTVRDEWRVAKASLARDLSRSEA